MRRNRYPPSNQFDASSKRRRIDYSPARLPRGERAEVMEQNSIERSQQSSAQLSNILGRSAMRPNEIKASDDDSQLDDFGKHLIANGDKHNC